MFFQFNLLIKSGIIVHGSKYSWHWQMGREHGKQEGVWGQIHSRIDAFDFIAITNCLRLVDRCNQSQPRFIVTQNLQNVGFATLHHPCNTSKLPNSTAELKKILNERFQLKSFAVAFLHYNLIKRSSAAIKFCAGWTSMNLAYIGTGVGNHAPWIDRRHYIIYIQGDWGRVLDIELSKCTTPYNSTHPLAEVENWSSSIYKIWWEAEKFQADWCYTKNKNLVTTLFLFRLDSNLELWKGHLESAFKD